MNTPQVFSSKEEYTFSHMSYARFLNNKRNFFDILKHGYSSSSLHTKLSSPTFIHKLYHEKNPEYMSFLNEFKERYHDYDVIVMNPGLDLVHPEFLYKNFPKALKCLHFIDDPHLTYSYCLPFSWAFDCATYVSPSYSDEFKMSEILNLAGFKHIKWLPHCVTNNHDPQYSIDELEEQLKSRENKALYVGNFYTSKAKRLIKIKRELKDDLDIYGRHPLMGIPYPVLSTLNGNLSLKRIKAIPEIKREDFYSRYAIGLNMHLSYPARETGNARLYELAYRGVSQVVDSGQYSAVSDIFSPDKEILTYENPKECIAQIRRLQGNEQLRISIALNAYKRAISEYSYEIVLNNTCDWFKSLIINKNTRNVN